MRVVPRWALLCAGAAPVFLVGGWTLGAARQPGGFDPVAETISELAAVGAADRWIMTLGLVGLGLCYCASAAALRPVAPAGRALLALGGVGVLAVAALPRPVDGESTAHTLAAVVAFAALALWPALAAAPGGAAGGRARWLALAVALLVPVLWFAVEFVTGGDRVGLAERVAAGAEALAPLLAVGWLRRRR